MIELQIIDSGEKTSNAVLRADAIRFSLVKEVTGVNDQAEQNFPKEYELNQNYPNPFNLSTIISYSLPDDEFVTLKVYDILGREVTTLVNQAQKAGNYKINFLAGDLATGREGLASGIYLYKITAGSFVKTKKMVFIK